MRALSVSSFLLWAALAEAQPNQTLTRELVNSVLTARAELFAQPMRVDGCSLSVMLGDSARDNAAVVDTAFRRFVVPGAPARCLRTADVAPGVPGALVFFQRITAGDAGIVPVDTGLPPRRGLMTVTLTVGTIRPSGAHIEEWVMREARPHVWVAVAMRVSSIGAS